MEIRVFVCVGVFMAHGKVEGEGNQTQNAARAACSAMCVSASVTATHTVCDPVTHLQHIIHMRHHPARLEPSPSNSTHTPCR